MSDKYVFIDTETTGVDPKVHGVVQVAALMVYGGDIQDKINLDIAPFPDDAINMQALDVIGKTREEIEAYPHPRTQWAAFTAWLQRHIDRYDKFDKARFAAFNAPFDNQFMRAWFEKCGDKYFGSYFWFPCVDVAQTAFEAMTDKQRGELPNFKLETVAGYYGVKVQTELTHDAMYDTVLTLDLYNAIRPMI